MQESIKCVVCKSQQLNGHKACVILEFPEHDNMQTNMLIIVGYVYIAKLGTCWDASHDVERSFVSTHGLCIIIVVCLCFFNSQQCSL